MAKKKIEFIGKSKMIANFERDGLIEYLIKKAFEKRLEKLKKELTDFSDDVYQEFVGCYADELKKLPKRWTEKSTEICANIKRIDYEVRRHFDFVLSKEMIFPKVQSYYETPEITAKEYPELVKRLEKIDQKLSKYLEDKAQLRSKTKAAVYSCKSTKQLFDSWPEAYAVFLELNPNVQSSTFLPMIPREDLNKELGL